MDVTLTCSIPQQFLKYLSVLLAHPAGFYNWTASLFNSRLQHWMDFSLFMHHHGEASHSKLPHHVRWSSAGTTHNTSNGQTCKTIDPASWYKCGGNSRRLWVECVGLFVNETCMQWSSMRRACPLWMAHYWFIDFRTRLVWMYSK